MPNDPLPEAEIDQASDRQLREIASGIAPPGSPSDLGARVLGKVRERRVIQRTVIGSLAVVALTTALFLPRFTMHESMELAQSSSTNEMPPSSQAQAAESVLDSFDSDYLAAPPPVASLDVIDQNRLAMVELIASLGRETP